MGEAKQLDMFGPPKAWTPPSPNLPKIRADLQAWLAEAKAAETMPWSPDKLLLYRTLFPQMSNWLPPEEKKQLCDAFEAELARLEAA